MPHRPAYSCLHRPVYCCLHKTHAKTIPHPMARSQVACCATPPPPSTSATMAPHPHPSGSCTQGGVACDAPGEMAAQFLASMRRFLVCMVQLCEWHRCLCHSLIGVHAACYTVCVSCVCMCAQVMDAFCVASERLLCMTPPGTSSFPDMCKFMHFHHEQCGAVIILQLYDMPFAE